MSALKAVIFDMDGVLVDSNEAHFEAFKRLGRELGVDFTRELLLKTVGMHNVQIMPLWLGESLGAALTREKIDELGVRKEIMYREVAASKIKAIPGSVELLRAVREHGLKTAVGSSGPRENVALALKTLRIEDSFHALVTGSDISTGKPNPEVFLKAAAKLGIEPGHCLVIEDAPSGVQAAINAGMRVVAITTSRPAADLRDANLVIDRFADLAVSRLLELV